MEPLSFYRGGRLLRIAANDDGTFTLTTRDSEIVVTEHELAWLCDISGPAQLWKHRQEAQAA